MIKEKYPYSGIIDRGRYTKYYPVLIKFPTAFEKKTCVVCHRIYYKKKKSSLKYSKTCCMKHSSSYSNNRTPYSRPDELLTYRGKHQRDIENRRKEWRKNDDLWRKKNQARTFKKDWMYHELLKQAIEYKNSIMSVPTLL